MDMTKGEEREDEDGIDPSICTVRQGFWFGHGSVVFWAIFRGFFFSFFFFRATKLLDPEFTPLAPFYRLSI